MAQISEPLAAADIPAYYISTFKFDHALVSVVSGLGGSAGVLGLMGLPCPPAGTRGKHPRGHRRPEGQPSGEALGGRGAVLCAPSPCPTEPPSTSSLAVFLK